MQITEEEVIKDIEEGKLYRSVPVTGYTFSVSDSFHERYKVELGYDMVGVECLVNFVNFYLEKKMEDVQHLGEVVVTTNESGECILVSRQDEDHKILKIIWEKK